MLSIFTLFRNIIKFYNLVKNGIWHAKVINVTSEIVSFEMNKKYIFTIIFCMHSSNKKILQRYVNRFIIIFSKNIMLYNICYITDAVICYITDII